MRRLAPPIGELGAPTLPDGTAFGDEASHGPTHHSPAGGLGQSSCGHLQRLRWAVGGDFHSNGAPRHTVRRISRGRGGVQTQRRGARSHSSWQRSYRQYERRARRGEESLAEGRTQRGSLTRSRGLDVLTGSTAPWGSDAVTSPLFPTARPVFLPQTSRLSQATPAAQLPTPGTTRLRLNVILLLDFTGDTGLTAALCAMGYHQAVSSKCLQLSETCNRRAARDRLLLPPHGEHPRSFCAALQSTDPLRPRRHCQPPAVRLRTSSSKTSLRVAESQCAPPAAAGSRGAPLRA